MSQEEAKILLNISEQTLEDLDKHGASFKMLTNLLTVITSLDGRMQNIEKGIAKIDSMKEAMDGFIGRIETVEKNIDEMKTQQLEIESGMEAMSKVVDSVIDHCSSYKTEIDTLNIKLKEYENTDNEIVKQYQQV